MSGASPAGVLICGAYGTGKSTVAEEIAMRLEAGGGGRWPPSTSIG